MLPIHSSPIDSRCPSSGVSLIFGFFHLFYPLFFLWSLHRLFISCFLFFNIIAWLDFFPNFYQQIVGFLLLLLLFLLVLLLAPFFYFFYCFSSLLQYFSAFLLYFNIFPLFFFISTFFCFSSLFHHVSVFLLYSIH